MVKFKHFISCIDFCNPKMQLQVPVAERRDGWKGTPFPLRACVSKLHTPPWLLHHLFLVVNKPTDNSNNQSRKPKPLAHNRLKDEHQRKLSLWDNIDIKVAFNCCWRKLTRWWWIENICGLVCGPTLGTIPYTRWVGRWVGGWNLIAFRCHFQSHAWSIRWWWSVLPKETNNIHMCIKMRIFGFDKAGIQNRKLYKKGDSFFL